MDEISKSNDGILTRHLERIKELEKQGYDRSRASGIASLEIRINQWPESWSKDLQILIYGDFDPPKKDIHFPSLGITLHPEKLKDTVLGNIAIAVLKATVEIDGKEIKDLNDASKRINTLLGILTIEQWCNCSFGWWNYIIQGPGSGAHTDINFDIINKAIEKAEQYSPEVRKRLDAALYWIREPKLLIREFYRIDVFRTFSSYWNAFECLIEAVNKYKSLPKLTREEKEEKINEILKEKSYNLSLEDCEMIYRDVVNPPFKTKAEYALKICFKNDAEKLIFECFEHNEVNQRLYKIRNAINHGDIESENPEEIIRIESRLDVLKHIVLNMFGVFIPVPVPTL
jgi:hypothetical protein